ncbi:MAG TPA: hypothetical protein VLM38_18255 [Blastocatellia bacterium]|nr:hypothetical protein [Blastocatellia bacterium]
MRQTRGFASRSASEETYDSYQGHPISGPLIKTLLIEMSANSTAKGHGRVVLSLIQAIIMIPIWLMIVLLSPLDAYAAAKNTLRGVD